MINKKISIKGMDILIVDDNSKNLQVIGNILTDEEFNLRFAMDGLRALKAVEIKKPDLILLDINMPEMDGFELCEVLKNDEKTYDIPVIFLTAARKDEESIIKGFKVGAVDYITKPFNHEELLARVKSQLEIKALMTSYHNTIEEKNRMFSILIHDIKNPFSGILGISELALKQMEKLTIDKITNYMELINSSGYRIYNLLEDLTSWIGLQNDRIEFLPEKVNIDKAIIKIINLFSENINSKNIEIIFDAMDLYVYADKKMFETIIRNFINNAVKYSKINGIIKIKISEEKKFVKIIISDNGVGMSEETIKRLKKNILNISTEGTNQEKGSGLGVGICREMILKNGGTFDIVSKETIGTQVIFQIPKYNEEMI